MGNFTVDPITGILIPTVGVDPGPDYATNVSNALTTLAHLTHTGASNLDGYQIPSAGINFNADISAQNNNLTSLRTARFQSQSSDPSGSGDIDNIYFKAGDLWITNGAGTHLQITAGSSIAVSATNNYVTVTTTTNLTINSADTTVLVSCDSTSGPLTITLPLANSVPAGRFYMIKDRTGQAHTNNITINPAGSDTMDGAASYSLTMNLGAVAFVSNGSNRWLVFNYDKNLYHTGESVTFESGADLYSAGVFHIQGRTTMDGYVLSTGSYTIPTANSATLILCIPSAGPLTVNLPPAPSAPNGTMIIIKDAWGTAGTNNITIVPNGNNNIEGLNAPKKITSNWGSITLVSATAFANNYWVML